MDISRPLQQAVLDDIGCRLGGYETNQLDLYQDVLKNSRRGCSLLSRKIARALYFSNRKKLPSPLEEALLAVRVENELNHPQILSLYLNTTYFGGNNDGAEAASRAYFNHPASQVNASEAAWLTGQEHAGPLAAYPAHAKLNLPPQTARVELSPTTPSRLKTTKRHIHKSRRTLPGLARHKAPTAYPGFNPDTASIATTGEADDGNIHIRQHWHKMKRWVRHSWTRVRAEFD
jgi:hypothetical protein